MAKHISIRRVAQDAGVSISTASRVLNHSDHPVKDETAQRVVQSAERLGYAPSALARALVMRRSGIIGALVGDNADPYFATIVHGIHEIAHSKNALVMVCNTLRDPRVELDYFRTLASYHADGIILAGGALTGSEYVERFKAASERYCRDGGQIVTLSERQFRMPSVRVDNIQASFDMVTYLSALGHRKIAHIRGPNELMTTNLRAEGYLRALDSADVPFRDEYMLEGDFSFEAGLAAMAELANLADAPTAVFAASDLIAIGCVVKALELGLNVPKDISIAGMDNIESARYLTPQLTTLNIPMAEIGRKAAEQIFARIEHEEVPDTVVMPHSLVIRGSTAPPAKPGSM